MPWHVAKSSECPESKPWAVIKDSDSSVVACHTSEDSANDQMAALYASEEGRQRMTIREVWERVKDMFELALDAQDVVEGLERAWDGSASNYDSTDDYCSAC